MNNIISKTIIIILLLTNNSFAMINFGLGPNFSNGEEGNESVIGYDGNDNIYCGSGTNIIQGGAGNDILTGGEDDDRIEGGDGNDIIFGRSGGDELYGGSGDDIISAGQGNDILIDGKGSDNLIGGADNDIFILSKNYKAIDSDVIEDFNKNEDTIIIKLDYDKPITFTTLQSLMSQNGDDIEINFASGQKIIIKNTLLSDLNSDNVTISLDEDLCRAIWGQTPIFL